MAKAGLESKNRYQQCIVQYVIRRNEYKLKYGVRSKKFSLLSKRINKKLSCWRRAIKRIEIWDAEIFKLDQKITEFIGRSVFGSIFSKDKQMILAKNLFVKYGMENGVQGVLLCEYMGGKGKWTASKRRMKFTKTLSTNIYNKEMWLRFNEFMNRDCLEIKKAA